MRYSFSNNLFLNIYLYFSYNQRIHILVIIVDFYHIITILSLGIKFAHFAEAVRYDIIFPLPFQHEWTLIYTYRVLISPTDMSLE